MQPVINDVIVMGAGIAGSAAAYELAEHSSVLLIEAEPHPGYHSSGRSAALFTRNFGPSLVRRINSLSEPFLQSPEAGFTDTALLRTRGALTVANSLESAELDAALAHSTPQHPIVELPVADAVAMVPFLRSDNTLRAVYEAGVSDIETSVLLHSYLKGLKRRGGKLITGEPVVGMKRHDGIWTVVTNNASHRARTVVNAAGAWADDIGRLAGATQIGLVPKRRTAIVVDAPPGHAVAALPLVDFSSWGPYLKPEAGQLMVSPGDATPVAPQDVQPDEMDVAKLVDWLERETLIPVHRIAHSWAGLRSFVSDDCPVVGYDPKVPDFIWHAAHGGYGIMMAPALSRAVASLCHSQTLPADFINAGITEEELSCARFD